MADTNSASKKLFREIHDFDKRKLLSAKMRTSYPDRVPVIVERHQRSRTVPEISKTKFLSPDDLTVAQFMMEIRQHMDLNPTHALFLFVGSDNSSVPNPGALMIQVYDQHKDEDGFLYVSYAGEKSFGCL
eukprot:TRINITY_DN2291_c0_g1_i1.p1 TRINITY_DN2291_c0_g1~~TRINITY_DN2291_c0_g1_i1.p1  ORF type:complete len:130 (+),score=23.25 TRINITY_DN2291_c0_g1_i1:117-506(+)